MTWRHINREKLEALRPCPGRWKNYLNHYPDFEGDILEFLELRQVSAEDKVWAAVRLCPRFIIEIFAVDCAFRAATYAEDAEDAEDAANAAADATAATATDYAADAADAADDAANSSAKQERERQVDALIYLIEAFDNEPEFRKIVEEFLS